MSSHHIIREKQEPALLVLGLDNFPDELLGQLLEWSPTVIVTVNTAENMNAFGIKFDVLIEDAGMEGDIQSDIKYISLQGNTVTTAALKYLVSNNYPAVNVIADAMTLDDYLPYTSQINMVIFNQGQKIYPITSGFTKWKPAGELITLLSECGSLNYTGIEPIGNAQYKTIHDGFFTLYFNEPFIFIAESIT